jgi:SAM-dependent methyltransferase
MTVDDPRQPFRATEPFLQDVIAGKFLSTAFVLGLIERLIAAPASDAEIARSLGLTRRGADLLLAALANIGVISRRPGSCNLTDAFSAALQWRDLLEARLQFAELVLPDLAGLTTPLIGSGEEFMARSATFELFRYDRAKHRTPDNLAATARWVDLLTVLSRYEANGLLHLLERKNAERLLDVGGNSGALMEEVLRFWPGSAGYVFDLPVVCELGRQRMTQRGASDRITFVEGDLRQDSLPGNMDLILFKSVLHDWSDAQISAFLGKAAASVRPGGRIAIFERLPFDFSTRMPRYHDLPNLMFFQVFREPRLYFQLLESVGLEVVQHEALDLDMPFFLIVGQKPLS